MDTSMLVKKASHPVQKIKWKITSEQGFTNNSFFLIVSNLMQMRRFPKCNVVVGKHAYGDSLCCWRRRQHRQDWQLLLFWTQFSNSSNKRAHS